MVSVNPALLPVIAPPDLPYVARDAVDLVLGEAGRMDVDPEVQARRMADELIESGRWRLDPADETSLSVAEWAMRLVAQAHAEIEQAESARAEFMRQIAQWFDDATMRARATIAFFDAHLTDYQRQRRLVNDKAKSLKLPSGVVKSTRYQPSIEVDDADTVISWAKEVGLAEDLVQVTESLRKAELNRQARAVVVTEAGTGPDGPIVESYVEIDVGDDEKGATLRVPGVHVVAGHVDVKVVPR